MDLCHDTAVSNLDTAVLNFDTDWRQFMENICERRTVLSSMQRDFFAKFERNMADLHHHINDPSLITSVISFSLYDRWCAQSELHRSFLKAFVRLQCRLVNILVC